MVQTAALSLDDIDLVRGDRFLPGPPHDQWKLLRERAPLFWHEGLPESEAGFDLKPFWCITKYDDVIFVSRNPTTFISGKGIHLSLNPENEPQPEFGGGTMMITMDPPRHVRLRRLVNKGFTPRMVGALEPHVAPIVTRIIDDVAGRERVRLRHRCLRAAAAGGDLRHDGRAARGLAPVCSSSPTRRSARTTRSTRSRAPGEDSGTASARRMEMFQYFAQLVARSGAAARATT